MTDQDAVQNAAPAAAQPDAGTVSAIRSFAAGEQGAKAVLQPAGAAGVRITLVGDDDGILGDRVVDSLDEAKAVIAALDNVEIADEWDRDLTSRATVAPSHWRKMAGHVANQKRFPRARNRASVDYR